MSGGPAKTAFIGGTGLSLDIDVAQTEPFPTRPTTVSHHGEIQFGTLASHPIVNVKGRLHAYEGGGTAAMFPIYERLAAAGVEQVVISGAVGSMHPELPPGAWAQVSDHLFFGGMSPLVGRPNAFVPLAAAYHDGWGARLPRVTYAWTHGPHLETPAEIRALKAMGGHVVGMSLAPEAIIARYLGLRVYGLVCAVNWAAGQGGGDAPAIPDILATAQAAAAGLPALLDPILKAA